MGTDGVITDPQEPGKRSLEPSVFTPVACGDGDSPERQRPAFLQQRLGSWSHRAKAAEPIQDEHRRGVLSPIAHQQLTGLAIERKMDPYRALRMPDDLTECEQGRGVASAFHPSAHDG